MTETRMFYLEMKVLRLSRKRSNLRKKLQTLWTKLNAHLILLTTSTNLSVSSNKKKMIKVKMTVKFQRLKSAKTTSSK